MAAPIMMTSGDTSAGAALSRAGTERAAAAPAPPISAKRRVTSANRYLPQTKAGAFPSPRPPVSIGSEALADRQAERPRLVGGEDKPRPSPALEIGRAHVCTPVTSAQLVCRLLLEK